MSFPRSLLLSVLLGSLTLTGFGCKKIDSMRPNTAAFQANTQVKLPTISVRTKPQQPAPPVGGKPESTLDPEITRLRDVMVSFQKSQSFRATITIGGSEGVKGEIAYNKPSGMFGKLFLQNGFTTEMAVKDERVAVRSGTSTWAEVTGAKEGEHIALLFASITNQGNNEPLYPSHNTRSMTSKDDTARNCRMHTLSHFMGNLGGYQPIHICVQNGLPVYFSAPSEDGLIEISYRDIDKPVEVFFPIP